MNGTVTFFNAGRNFGFIESQGTEYFFYPNIVGKRYKNYIPRLGDDVEFSVVKSDNGDDREVAVVSTYLGNKLWDEFVKSCIENPSRGGYLKRVNESWSVKVMPEKFFIPIKGPGKFEVDIQSVYDDRENNWVDAIVKVSSKGKLSCELLDRKLAPEYLKLAAVFAADAESIIKGKVTGVNDDVYFVLATEFNLSGAILKKSIKEGIKLHKGQDIPVQIASLTISNLSFRLADRHLNSR